MNAVLEKSLTYCRNQELYQDSAEKYEYKYTFYLKAVTWIWYELLSLFGISKLKYFSHSSTRVLERNIVIQCHNVAIITEYETKAPRNVK